MTRQLESRPTRRKPRFLRLLLTLVCCFALYCAFTEKLAGQELVLAGLSSVLCTLFAVLLLRCAPLARFRVRDVVQGWRVPFYIVQRVAQITWLLLRDVFGKQVSSIFRQTTFCGECEDPEDTGRRVLATLYTTAAPNFIVLQIDAREHALHFHQLTRTDVSDMLQKLGAES